MPVTTDPPLSTSEKQSKTNAERKKNSLKRPRGRPLEHGISTIQTGSDGVPREIIVKAPDIPPPPSPVMGYNTEYPDKAFFGYWNEIEKLFPKRLTGYVYRLNPVIDRELTQQHLPKEDRVLNIEKLYKPPLDSLEIFHRFGAGDYDIRLNDQARQGASLTRCFLRGERDWNRYPPVLDIRELIMEDPVNQSYIKWARSTGVLKDEDRQGEEDMANVASVEAIGSLVEGMKDMAQQAVEQADKRAETSRADQDGRRSTDVDAAAQGMKIVADAATMGTKMIEGAVNRAAQLSDPTAQAAVLDKVLDVATKLAGIQTKAQATGEQTPSGGINAGELLKIFMERETRLQSSVLQLTEARFKDLELRVQQPGGTQPNPLDPLAQTRSMLSFFKELDEFRGGGDSAPAKTTIWDTLPKIFTGLAALGSVIVTGIHNANVMKTGKGTTMQPQLPAPENEGEQPPLQIPGQTQPDPANPMAQYHRFLEGIRLPMLGMMNDEGRETPGADFADWLMEAQGGGPQGRQFYEGLKAQGPDAIKALFQSYPPLWNQLAQIEAKFDSFLEQFFQHDEIRQAELASEEEPEPVKPVRRVKVMTPTQAQPGA